MTASLKQLMDKIRLRNAFFIDGRSKEVAEDVCKRHTLQSVLESLSDLKVKETNKPNSVIVEDNIEYLNKVQLLIDCCHDTWLLEFANGFKNSDTSSLCIGSLRTVARTATLHFQKDKDMDMLEQKDFDSIKPRAEWCLKIFTSLFSKIRQSVDSQDLFKCCRHVIVFSLQVLTQHLESNFWTTNETMQISKNLLQDFLSYIGSFEAKDILTMDISGQTSGQTKNSVFGKLITEWKPFLLRDTWKHSPMTVASFVYCLRSVTFPNLSDFLEQVLPPSLIFLDDYTVRHKVMGIDCIVHIIKNSSAEELRWYGRADVIYEALKHQLYSTEESLLQLTYPAILEILKVIVKPSTNLSDSTKYDEILQMVLQSAAHENKLILRRIHTEYFALFFERMGVTVTKHLQSILELIEEYLDTSDAPSEQSRLNVLKALNMLLIVAWPRVKCHTFLLTKSLVKLIHNVTSDSFNTSDEIKSQVIDESLKCLDLMMAIDPFNMSGLLKAAKETGLSSSCIAVMDGLLSKC